MANKTDTIKQLPAIFQTVTERKFFDATFDQVFSKQNSERLTGWIGRRIGGEFDPVEDFYLPEQTKDRTWYQLEPMSSVLDINTLERSNQFFYDDLINNIRYYGGNTYNHDRLFNSYYYSYSPPIDADKYVNYQNYFWLPDRLPTVTITGVDDLTISTQILGKAHYTAPNGFVFTNDVIVSFPDSASYKDPLTVINVGRAINFIPDYPEILLVKRYNLLPWDSEIDIASTTSDNSRWGSLPWDAVNANSATPDYITMEQGSVDRNAWSRTNSWYHIDTINEVITATGNAFPSNATRAQRPILEFFKNIELYDSGSKYVSDVTYFMASGTPTELECVPIIENYSVIRFSEIQGAAVSVVKQIPSFANISYGETIVFPCDESDAYLLTSTWDAGINNTWDELHWASTEILDSTGAPIPVKKFVWKVEIKTDQFGVDIVVLSPYAGTANITDAALLATPALAVMEDGDIILVTGGVTRFEDNVTGHYGETYYFKDNHWRYAYNQKSKANQAIKFNLYDTSRDQLDSLAYPDSNFRGSDIFSYKIDTASNAVVDGILGFPVVYKTLGQTSDIMFENDLQTERYEYVVGSTILPITGYYYYKVLTDNDVATFENSWYSAQAYSEQDVIERFTVLDTSLNEFILDVSPYNDTKDNIVLRINGVKTDNFTYSIKNGNPIITVGNTLELYDTLEVFVYTYDYLFDIDNGYFEIPQQLEANPSNKEVFEQSFGEFSTQFTTILENQPGFVGSPLGYNNYRDTIRDPSLGTKILQNESSLLKAMFVSGDNDLDAIQAIRFAGNDYVNYRAKFLKVAVQLWNRGFQPSLFQGDIEPDLWLEEILKVVTISREFSDAFAYSYMLARSDVFRTASVFNNDIDDVHTPIAVDLTNPRNAMYLYKVTDAYNNEMYTASTLLVVNVDYEIVDYETGAFVFLPDSVRVSLGDKVAVRAYNDCIPAYMPATPTKLGTTTAWIPAIVLDTSYATPALMIVGHDGSRTPVYGTYDTSASILAQRLISLYEGDTQVDIRDVMLFELEKRIYNGLNPEFTVKSDVLLRIVDIRPGTFRQTYEPNLKLFRTTPRNRYTRNEYYTITESYFAKWTAENKADYRQNEFYNPSDWRTWNYSTQTDNVLFLGNPLPGYWKGVFTWYYDTIYPATAPWEMLGYDIMPEWWTEEYGTFPWAATNKMWADIEAGQPARGDIKAGQARYARPGLSAILPVYADGLPKPLPEIFNITATDWYGIDGPWVYGDGAPVEQAWYDSPEYKFSEMEFFYLMRPAEFGEKFWNPAQVKYNDLQLLDQETEERQKNSTLVVHGETVGEQVTYKSGYQQYITDYLLFLGKDITDEFGDKVRRLDVQLGHKMGAFTNKDTLRMKLESAGVDSTQGDLIIPTNNYQVNLYKGASIADYVYSGVIIRAVADGSFKVYGYDILNQSFKMLLPVTNGKQQKINIGGTPAAFTDFEFDKQYYKGDIVRYNTRFYMSNKDQLAVAFISANWDKLGALPQTGGISVTWYQEREPLSAIIPYGTRFESVQNLYDFLIGYGAWLEEAGWQFDAVNDLNQPVDWKTAADQFLFWVSNDWAPDESLFLSPASEAPTLEVKNGYPDMVERMSNGVYSILNKYGIAIAPADTVINRDNKYIQVIPKTPGEGIYYLRISAKETEHILTFDNTTSFNDIIYDPLLNARQDRLLFSGIRTLDWIGKYEAAGYLIENSRLIQNFENITDSIRYYYDSDTALDNPSIDAGARHLIGYENREFLDQLGVSDDVQFNFYQGFIRQKGTANAITKLLRSDEIQDKDAISFFEEWCLKMGEFGGVAENLSVEFVSMFDDVNSDPQVYRLNYQPSLTGSIKNIVLYNAEELYSVVPTILVEQVAIDPITLEPVITWSPDIAKAVLGSNRKIIRIDVIDPGFGYTKPPAIKIVPVLDLATNLVKFATKERALQYSIDGINTDSAYAVLQMDVMADDKLDAVIDIDVDDNVKWLYCPPEYSVPFTNNTWTSYETPNAGYVHTDDVDYMAFDNTALLSLWNSDDVPEIGSTVWIAKNPQEDWGVYRVTPATTEFLLDKPVDDIEFYVDSNEFVYGSTITKKNKLYYNTRFKAIVTSPDGVLPYTYDTVVVSGTVNIIYPEYNKVFKYNVVDTATGLAELINEDGSVVDLNVEFKDVDLNTIEFNYFINLRYKSLADIDPNLPLASSNNPWYWIDNLDNKWAVCALEYVGTELAVTIHRQQIPLVDSTLYNNAYLRDRTTNAFIAYASITDPFKDVFLGQISQNIDYKSSSDPSHYNNASDPRLINTNKMFGEEQLGQVWWDLSDIRYMYYEQSPVYQLADNAAERTKVLAYRRLNWGKVFPGSVASVYEWTQSDKPPADYDGTGHPKNLTDYVEVITQNNSTGFPMVTYYYWVALAEDKPNNINRTLSVKEVAALLVNPSSLRQPWYAPIQDTGISTSYAFGVTYPNLTSKNVTIEIDYALRANANTVHDQWLLLDEGNRFSIIPDSYWSKMVDSLVGYTYELPREQYPFGFPVSDTMVVLPVPALNLSIPEKLGIGIRPQQTMFSDILGARKVMAQSVNTLMANVRLWADRYTDWDANITSSQYWSYIDWYLDGYNYTNTISKIQVADYDQLYDLIGKIADETMVKVYPFTPDINDKFEIYQYSIDDDSFTLVRRQDGTMAFKDAVYVDIYSNTLRSEIRQVLDSLKENVFVGDIKVYENLVFFAMLNYTFSEQNEVDWAFKSSYISFIQDDIALEQRPKYQSDLLTEFLAYIQEAKPYRTKVRETTTIIASAIDIALGTAYDDAMGDFACFPVIPPFPDPVYPGEMVTESCYWINDSITETLRNFKLKIDFSRTSCDNPSAVCHQQIIDGGPFTIGWDIFHTNASVLLGWSIITGLPVEYSFAYFGWDETVWDNDNIPVDIITVGEPSNTVIDAENFIYPYGIPEELVPLGPVESLVITSTYDNVIADENDTNPQSVSFRMNLNPMGWVEYIRISDRYSSELAEDLYPDSTIIQLVDASNLSQPEPGLANVIWVEGKKLSTNGTVVSTGTERIEYRGKVGNTLFDITRGTLGTSIVAVAEAAVSVVNDGNQSQYISRPDNVVVSQSGYTLPTGEILPGAVMLTTCNYYPPEIAGDPVIVVTEDILAPNFDPWFELYQDNTTNTESLIASTPQAKFLLAAPKV